MIQHSIHLDDVRRTLFQSLSLRRAGVRALRATHLTLGQGLHILKSAHRAGPVLLFSVFDRPCKAVRLDRSKRRRCAWLSPLLLLLLLWPLLGRLKGLLLRLRLCMIGSRRCPIFTRLQLDLHEPTCILGYSGRVRLCSSLLQSTNLFLLLCNGCFETFSLLDQGSYSRVSSLFLRVRLRDLPTSSEHRALQLWSKDFVQVLRVLVLDMKRTIRPNLAHDARYPLLAGLRKHLDALAKSIFCGFLGGLAS
mmetsp:Transcript_53575/g.125702  ORF Transcript_53575/g.125702 Transcript_53575/m.125702 type:complete len:250 (-) Transcript_53575:197-946(-)